MKSPEENKSSLVAGPVDRRPVRTDSCEILAERVEMPVPSRTPEPSGQGAGAASPDSFGVRLS